MCASARVCGRKCETATDALEPELPSTKVFQDALQTRHDIVHRSGADKEGNPVVIGADDVRQLAGQVEAFCEQVAAKFDSDF